MKRFFVAGIFLLAFILRVYALATVPPSASLDEASIGYNAYSIFRTGADEYGNRFPLLLRAYDDYRPALYVYLVIPFLPFFGLTALSVRLPSLILSMLTVFAVYKIGILLGGQDRKRSDIGLWAALVLAVSPWHIYISRLGHEANLGSALLVLGVYFFLLQVLGGKRWSLIPSAVCFALSLHGYQSQKILSPLLVMLGTFIFGKTIFKDRRILLWSVLAGLIIAVPAVLVTISPEGLSRFSGTSAFSEYEPKVAAARDAYLRARQSGDWVGRVVYQRYVVDAKLFLENYASHFSPRWIFAGGNREAHKVPGMGLLYPWEGLLLILGVYGLVTKVIDRKRAWFVVGGILLSPVPAALTTQAPHAMRAFGAVPFLALLEGVGVIVFVSWIGKKQGALVSAIVAGVMASSLATFWNGYFVRFPAEQSDAFQYAMRPAVSYVREHGAGYRRIVFANQGPLYQSYMFYLFYSVYDPSAYQATGGTRSGGYDQSHSIGTADFGYPPDSHAGMGEGVLYLYDATAIPEGGNVVVTFANADGSVAIAGVVK